MLKILIWASKQSLVSSQYHMVALIPYWYHNPSPSEYERDMSKLRATWAHRWREDTMGDMCSTNAGKMWSTCHILTLRYCEWWWKMVYIFLNAKQVSEQGLGDRQCRAPFWFEARIFLKETYVWKPRPSCSQYAWERSALYWQILHKVFWHTW